MTDEQKQIEKMAKVIQGIMYYVPDEEDDRYRYLTHLDKQSAKEIAEALITAGYRKQSDTVREIVERLKELLHKHEYRNQTDGVSFYQMNAESFCDEINDLAAQYGVEVEE